MQTLVRPKKFIGPHFTTDELLMIREVVGTYGGIRREVKNILVYPPIKNPRQRLREGR